MAVLGLFNPLFRPVKNRINVFAGAEEQAVAVQEVLHVDVAHHQGLNLALVIVFPAGAVCGILFAVVQGVHGFRFHHGIQQAEGLGDILVGNSNECAFPCHFNGTVEGCACFRCVQGAGFSNAVIPSHCFQTPGREEARVAFFQLGFNRVRVLGNHLRV